MHLTLQVLNVGRVGGSSAVMTLNRTSAVMLLNRTGNTVRKQPIENRHVRFVQFFPVSNERWIL